MVTIARRRRSIGTLGAPSGLNGFDAEEGDFAMKTLLQATVLCAAALSLAACGKSDKASQQANPENVEMPAEEAMSGVDASAAPASDPAAMPGAATAPADVSATSPAASAAAEKATTDAEKKM